MSARMFRWLGPLGFLGLLGFLPGQAWLKPLMAFMVFLVFFSVGVDERSEANLGRATALAYLATLVAFVTSFLWISVSGVRGWEALDLFFNLVVAVFVLHIVTFVVGYIYFDRRGA